MHQLLRRLAFCVSLFSGIATAGESILQDGQGHPLKWSTLRGKWVFINYWASWCGPCVQEIPELNRFYKAHQQEIALFAVNYDALPLEQQKILIKRWKISYPSLSDDPANTLHLGDIRAVPVTFVFNPKGALADTLYGGQTLETLNDMLAQSKPATWAQPE